MVYKKDPNVSWTDMCIYVDQHIYDDDKEVQSKCFEYIWFICYIDAYKGRYFRKYSDYEDFAFFAATEVYNRYRKNLDPNYTRPPIKSCKNYIKHVLRFKKINYQNKTFEQVFEEEYIEGIPSSIREQQTYTIKDVNSGIPRANFTLYLETITMTVKECLANSPYSNDKRMMHNIYLSCLLTFLKMITVANKDKKRARRIKKADLNGLREKDFQSNIVLYHLDASMFNYIATMYNKIKREVIDDMNYMTQDFEVSDDVINEMLSINLPNGNAEASQ